MLTIGRSAHFSLQLDYFVVGGICTCLGVSSNPIFLWNSSNYCPLNLLLVRSHQAEMFIVKYLIQERNNMTRVQVEPRLYDQSRHKNDIFTLSATLPTLLLDPAWKILPVGANLPPRLIPSLFLLIQPLDFIFYKILPALNIMMTVDSLFLPKIALLFIYLLLKPLLSKLLTPPSANKKNLCTA